MSLSAYLGMSTELDKVPLLRSSADSKENINYIFRTDKFFSMNSSKDVVQANTSEFDQWVSSTSHGRRRMGMCEQDHKDRAELKKQIKYAIRMQNIADHGF